MSALARLPGASLQTEPVFMLAYAASSGRWTVSQRAEPDAAALDTLTVLTLNTWFEAEHRALRYGALVRALGQVDADVVCLQEVTRDLVERLEAAEWVREQCVMVTSPGVYAGYGVAILSRVPLRDAWELPFSSVMNRSLLGVTLAQPGEPLVVASSHFESTTQMAASRVHQLRAAFAHLERYPRAVLTGDFNFDPRDAEQDAIDERYVDVWSALRGDEPGYTEDTTRNPMRLLHHAEPKHARYDRVLARLPGWVPERVALFGTEPIAEGVWLSDHFGVVASVRRR